MADLLPNTVYRLRVRARNIHGWSLLYSEVLEALTSMRPEAPAPVTTTVRDLNVRVSWQTPFDNYQAITRFEVYILSRDGQLYESKEYCDGHQFSSESTETHCDLPVKEVLQKEPFNLEFDDLVQARVRAYNVRGWSELSTANLDGARIQSEPLFMTAPTRDEQTGPSTIFVNWSPIGAPDNGNSDVTSYSLEFDANTGGQSWFTLVGYLSDYQGTSLAVSEQI